MRDSPEFRVGRWGEREVARWLESQGFYVVPLTAIQEWNRHHRAPMAEGESHSIILPDLDVWGKDGSRFVEVKTKQTASHYRKTGTFDHGIAEDNFLAYLECEKLSGKEAWLAICELGDPRAHALPRILLQRCSILYPHRREDRSGNMSDGKAYYFFPVGLFNEYPGPRGGVNIPPPSTPPVALRTIKDGYRPPQLPLGL